MERVVRSPRVAEMVADRLRSQILAGDVGDRLPPQEELLAKFKVGLPSIREALRILEVEGLVTVHRGNVGGATVHLPDTSNVAYMLGMVLESRQVPMDDIAAAIRQLEPMCAGMCSQRPDRIEGTVAALETLVDQQRVTIDDPMKFNSLAREFHEVVVDGCGNQSMALTVGSLVQLWTAQEQSWTEVAAPEGRFPNRELLQQIVDVHEKIAAAIKEGNTESAVRLSAAHLEAAQTYHLSVESRPHVVCAPLRYTQRQE
ncbi:MAG: FCD domain-containing protein [Acidimicrobiales bacterium]